MSIKRLLHLNGIKRYYYTYLINKKYVGVKKFEKKRRLLNKLGHSIGEGTKVVGPIDVTGKLIIGKNCWVGRNFSVYGNGTVTIGDNCDIAPEVAFVTGSHIIGDAERRAGDGITTNISVGNGCWLGARSTIHNDIGNSCVIGACSFVNKPIDNNLLVAGVPAKKIRDLI